MNKDRVEAPHREASLRTNGTNAVKARRFAERIVPLPSAPDPAMHRHRRKRPADSDGLTCGRVSSGVGPYVTAAYHLVGMIRKAAPSC